MFRSIDYAMSLSAESMFWSKSEKAARLLDHAQADLLTSGGAARVVASHVFSHWSLP
jgi:hypothetical protein